MTVFVHLDSKGAGVEGRICLQPNSFLGCPEPDSEGHRLETGMATATQNLGRPEQSCERIMLPARPRCIISSHHCCFVKNSSTYMFLSQNTLLDIFSQEVCRKYVFLASWLDSLSWLQSHSEKKCILPIPLLHQCPLKCCLARTYQGIHHPGKQVLECELILCIFSLVPQ